MIRRNYPSSVDEVVDPTFRYKREALRAVRLFAKLKPWTGSLTERKNKFRQLNRDLSIAYSIEEPELIFGRLNGSHSGSSCYIPALHRIVLVGRLSVLTYLH